VLLLREGQACCPAYCLKLTKTPLITNQVPEFYFIARFSSEDYEPGQEYVVKHVGHTCHWI
jgi:hypothetical protein